ncbi:MAG: adenine deaminase [Candidatus Bruticola sp.]
MGLICAGSRKRAVEAAGVRYSRFFAMDVNLVSTIQAARGLIPCDLLLRGAKYLNVFTRQFEEGDIAVYQGIIVGFGPHPARQIVDIGGKYVVPGFIDGHVHLESSMLTPDQYAAAVIPRGTTGVVADPHEYANVAGTEAVRYLERAASVLPLDIYVGVPSCVPATNLEHAGASLNAADIASIKDAPHVVGLAEMMNYPGVLYGDNEVLSKLTALGEGTHIDGHAPGLSGHDLQAYVAAGISTDHECTTLAEAEEKLSLGMRIMIREGSVARDLDALIPLAVGRRGDRLLDRLLLVTDDREPEDLQADGHMDYLCRKAIQHGVEPAYAFIMASWGTACCFNLPKVGAIAPGYRANLAVLETNDEKFSQGFVVKQVYRDGMLLAKDGCCLTKLPAVPLGVLAKNSVKLAPVSADKLKIAVPEAGQYTVHVMGVKAGLIVSEHLKLSMNAEVGRQSESQIYELKADPERDILKVAVLERHHASGNVGLGFVRGFGFKGGAIASTVAHDSHNLVVVGDNDEDMLVCIKEIEKMGGGLIVVGGGQVKASAALPVCGLVSDQSLSEVSSAISTLYREADKLGSKLKRPFMSLAFMTLPVIPQLKLSDVGLIDNEQFKVISLAEKI